MKICTQCDISKELKTFRASKTGLNGIHAWCRVCERALASKYAKNNKDKRNINQAIYRKRNPDKINAGNSRRRAAELLRTPKWLTSDHLTDIIQYYTDAIYLSNYTKVSHHVDHIIPLQGKNVSGLHVPWNLQLLTESENCSKKNRVSL